MYSGLRNMEHSGLGLPEPWVDGSPELDMCPLEGKVQNFKFSASGCLLRHATQCQAHVLVTAYSDNEKPNTSLNSFSFCNTWKLGTWTLPGAAQRLPGVKAIRESAGQPSVWRLWYCKAFQVLCAHTLMCFSAFYCILITEKRYRLGMNVP